jgi:hypothetical protein
MSVQIWTILGSKVDECMCYDPEICVPLVAEVCVSIWWRSRQEIWTRLAAYGYHSKVYQRPGGRISYIMVGIF